LIMTFVTDKTNAGGGGTFPSLPFLLSRGIKVLIFDLDGTLLDSMGVWNAVDVEFLARFGIEVTPDYTETVKRVSIDEAASYTQYRYKLPLTPAEIKDAWNSMVGEFYRNEVELKPGAFEYITAAHKAGFKIGIATALQRTNALPALRRCGIDRIPDIVVTLEDMPAGVDKGSPEIYSKILRYINAADPGGSASPSCSLVYDDVKRALDGARSGGFLTCAVYDDIGSGSVENWTEIKLACDYSVVRFDCE